VSAHVGALAGCAGISLVAGTGVACLAVPEAGEPRIIGGHGYLLGDEGGAFWIGRRGLGAALRAREGRGRETVLTARAEERYGDLDDVHVRIHDAERPVDAIARFAPDVLDASAGGDEVAIEIVDAAARELLSLAAAAAGCLNGDTAALALGGRLLTPGGELRRRLDALLRESRLRLEPRDAGGSPLHGAVALGLMADPGRFRDLVHVWRQAGPA
jgi:N-acetylglucosamine kinase-like BadF-type ATPase